MRRESFDPGHDWMARCSHCGHEYILHFSDGRHGHQIKGDPCKCRSHACHCERFGVEDGCASPHDGDRRMIVDRIISERKKHDEGYGRDVHHSPGRWLSAAMEELGEVARALHDGEMNNLPIELVQLCALCLAWLEDIERFGTGPMDGIAREVKGGERG